MHRLKWDRRFGSDKPEDNHLTIMVPVPTELVKKQPITHREFCRQRSEPTFARRGETGITHSISGHADLENAGGLAQCGALVSRPKINEIGSKFQESYFSPI